MIAFSQFFAKEADFSVTQTFYGCQNRIILVSLFDSKTVIGANQKK